MALRFHAIWTPQQQPTLPKPRLPAPGRGRLRSRSPPSIARLATGRSSTEATLFSDERSREGSEISSSPFVLTDGRLGRGRGGCDGCVRFVCDATSGEREADAGCRVKEKSVSVVLLAGGQGKRMGADMPKQYLPLSGVPIVLHSFHTFAAMNEVKEIIVVCDPSYQSVFADIPEELDTTLKFALPGKERQDSVFNGFQAIDENSELVCIHDSARPLISNEDIKKVLEDSLLYGAAVLGVPVKATIKEADSGSFVVKTLDRKILWEMQTPQVIKPKLLRDGFELVSREGLEVTDDVSIVEHLKHPVYVTEGSYTNIKVTTPEDLLLAGRILESGVNPCDEQIPIL